MVQDYAVLGSHGPLVQAAYIPRLLQPLDLTPTPSIIASLRPHLRACWPSALRALAAILPQAPGGLYMPVCHVHNTDTLSPIQMPLKSLLQPLKPTLSWACITNSEVCVTSSLVPVDSAQQKTLDI